MRELHVLSLGAGVQSTALYLMFMRGDIPIKLDAAIFADTQEEPQAVYRHLAWLVSLNGPPILNRTAGRIGDDLMSGRRTEGQGKARFASIPAFVRNEKGKIGKQKRQCSREYKTDVITRTIRRELLGLKPHQRIPKDMSVFQYIGMSFDEMGRASRVTKVFQKKQRWATPVFPLIERFMTRANCSDWIADKVPHETPRSACVFCPFHSDHEWDRLKREDPVGWARAVEVDAAIRAEGAVSKRGLTGKLFAHRQCSPLPLVQLDLTPNPQKAQTTINFAEECMGMCGV